MVFDCITFYNELDLLELRLNELNDVVDKVVIVESTVTFTNKPKPLYFAKNTHRFTKFLPKIIHVVVRDSPNVSLPWIIEHHQFAAVMRGLKTAKKSDIILLSCTDELPRKEKILEYKNAKGKHKAFNQAVCQYYLNMRAVGKGSVWPCTQMFRYSDLLTYADPYVARFSPIDLLIPDGGWHFTFMGNTKRVQKKLASFSHQEFNNAKFNTAEYISRVVRQGKDLLGAEKHFVIAPNTFLPHYVQDHPERFRDVLAQGPMRQSIMLDAISYAKQAGRIGIRALRALLTTEADS